MNIKLLLQPVAAILSMALLLMISCSDSGINTSAATPDKTAAATITVSIGAIGQLAKKKTIDLEQLILTLSSPGQDSIHDTTSISGTGGNDAQVTIGNLQAPRTWTATAVVLDANDSCIHNGNTEFTTIPADTVAVTIDLDANYSMLKVTFNNLTDSVTSVTLSVADVTAFDSTFDAGSEEDITFTFDYLEAEADGIEYDIFLRAGGSFYDNDTILYAADTTIAALSGVDTNYVIALKWVGPDIPHGAAEITVTIGAVGTKVVNAGFEIIADEIPTDNLTAYFPFNGNVTDMSPSEIAATNHGATLTTDRFGNDNAAYAFSGNGDYIDLGTANPATGNHFTLSVWIYLTDTIAYSYDGWYISTPVSKGNVHFQQGAYNLAIISSGYNQPITYESALAFAGVNTDESDDKYYLDSRNGIFILNQWHHLASTVSENSLKMYVDGEIVANTGITGQVTPTDLPLLIGRISGSAGHEDYFKGRLDDIRIYDQTLNGAQIRALFHENGWNQD